MASVMALQSERGQCSTSAYPKYFYCVCPNVIRSEIVSWRCEFMGVISIWHERHAFAGLMCPQCGERLAIEEITLAQAYSREEFRDGRSKQVSGSSE
jgi:hypothetical protein